MGANSKIEWTDASWNPIRGCSRVSEGCRNCYAERSAARQAGIGGAYEGLVILGSKLKSPPTTAPRWTGAIRLADERTLTLPLRWRRPRRIFVNSMSDLFHEAAYEGWIDQVFEVMRQCPQHIFQILTKRPENMLHYLTTVDRPFPSWPWSHVWLGISCEDQKTADERIPFLLDTSAAARWVSYEPALGPVDFRPWLTVTRERDHMLDWIVAGGESGPGARPAHPDWFRSVRDQCVAAGVPFFFKQWGEWAPAYALDGSPITQAQCLCGQKPHHDFTEGVGGDRESFRVGKNKAGRLLDGLEWNEFPVLAARAQEENAK
jgi:protein gp37